MAICDATSLFLHLDFFQMQSATDYLCIQLLLYYYCTYPIPIINDSITRKSNANHNVITNCPAFFQMLIKAKISKSPKYFPNL